LKLRGNIELVSFRISRSDIGVIMRFSFVACQDETVGRWSRDGPRKIRALAAPSGKAGHASNLRLQRTSQWDRPLHISPGIRIDPSPDEGYAVLTSQPAAGLAHLIWPLSQSRCCRHIRYLKIFLGRYPLLSDCPSPRHFCSFNDGPFFLSHAYG